MATDHAQPNEWLTLAESPYFVVEKGIVTAPWELSTTSDSFVILVVCEGTGVLRWADNELNFRAGECFLLPANLGSYTLDGRCTVLRSIAP